ncbi:MAG: thiamine pyrophosphate-dependent enzyme [Actinomycetota bacterium]|nr:thiamine pyrophosphate-dependent enzyme [Actinomycetota bacterium]
MFVATSMRRVQDPGSALISNVLAAMGFALPAAVGGATAFPNRRVICFVGDGGLCMVLGELDVLHHRQLNVTVIVFNDASLSLIKPKPGERQGGHGDIGYSAISLVGVASAVGMESATARRRSGLTTSLEAPPDRPYLIEACIGGSDYVAIMELALV